VVTVNIPRLGYLSRSREEFFERLAHTMDLAKDSLEIKRRVITKLMEEGLFPYSRRYLGTWDNHFSTIGLVGMNECCLNFLKKDLVHEDGRDFSLEVLNFMRDRLIQYQEATGNLYNLEATPAESTSYRLAKIDRERFPDIVTAGDKEPFYTNSSQLPVEYTSDLFHALDLQEEIQRKYTGGTVFHCFLGESIESVEGCKKLVKNIAEKYRIPYYTISPTFSVCTDHGYLKGEQPRCHQCGQETEIYARIVGYYRPVKNWNKGKFEEYHIRNLFENHEPGNVTHLRSETKPGREETSSDAQPPPGLPEVRKVPVLELNRLREPLPARVNGSGDWKLFTQPNCAQCDTVKATLSEKDLIFELYNLKESKHQKLFSQYYRQIRKTLERKDNGGLDLPVLISIDNEGQVRQYAMGPRKIEEMIGTS
jgi:ribonucleoside-triphosphate reductase